MLQTVLYSLKLMSLRVFLAWLEKDNSEKLVLLLALSFFILFMPAAFAEKMLLDNKLSTKFQ